MPDGTQRSSTKRVNDTLVEHADRLWQAERENAARIEARVQLVGGGSVALLGLGCFAFEWQYYAPSSPVCPVWATIAIHLLLALSLIFFALSLGRLYAESPSAKENVPVTATESMELKESDAGKPIKAIVWAKTYRAYLDLKRRNARQRFRLWKGQQLFSFGLIAIFFAILLYIFASLPNKLRAVTEHGPDNTAVSDQQIAHDQPRGPHP